MWENVQEQFARKYTLHKYKNVEKQLVILNLRSYKKIHNKKGK